jgi:asparagine synthase (glutamine-hydrolysing)
MFVLLAGPGSAGEELERMASELRGGHGAPRVWRDRERNAGAASLAPHFVPEDVGDAQPIVSEERIFVCQARIDNREELLPQLGLPADIPDSALLAAAYDRWGEECVQRIAGDFVFAAWHRADGRVVAAVDPMGTRRLLWTRIGGGIALSPQLPALLAHPRVSREPDLDAIARLFDIGIDRTTTAFTAIRALPGGERLVWRGNEVRIDRWWNPDSRPAVWYRDDREYAEETRELLTRAVAAQLRSSTPVSATLSGGLDSGSVTALAASLLAPSGLRLTAYTSVPEEGLRTAERPDWDSDDRHYAAATAALHGNIEHRLVSPEGRCPLDVLQSVHGRARTPIKPATNLIWLDRISTFTANSGSRVLLLGERGNTAFSWPGHGVVWELATRGRFRPAFAQAAAEARNRETSIARVVAGAFRRGLRAKLGRGRMGDAIDPPARQFLNHPPAPHLRANEYAQPAGSRAMWAAFLMTPKHVWTVEAVPQWGIEWRDPTGDRRLLERLLRYPQSAFQIGGQPRGLAREAMAGLLPDRVRLRRTRGAQAPDAPGRIAAHADRYRAALETMRSSSWCREMFDLDAVQRSLEAFAAGAQDYSLVVGFERAFGVGMFLAELEGTA